MAASIFLSRLDVQERYQTTRSTIYRWIDKDLFPPPIKLGPRMVRWRLTDLEKWEEERGAK